MTVTNHQTKSKRQVLLYPGEDNYFVVEVPSLPGCISQGKTREEAKRKYRRSDRSLHRSFARSGRNCSRGSS